MRGPTPPSEVVRDQAAEPHDSDPEEQRRRDDLSSRRCVISRPQRIDLVGHAEGVVERKTTPWQTSPMTGSGL